MHREPGGLVVERVADRLHDLRGHTRGLELARGDLHLAHGVGRPDHGDGAGLRRVGLGEGALETVLEVAMRLLVLLLGDVAATDERLGVELADRALGLDEVVHERLGHRGVIALVVPATAVADEVDHDVALELLAVAEREFRDPHDRLGVVAVHVEDRRLDGLRDIRRVDRRPGVARHRREPDLVVDDDVDRAARAVAAQLRHLHGLEDDALGRHRRIAVDEDRQGGEGADRLAVLLGAHDALEHAVDGLEVRWVRGERDGHLVSVVGGERALGAEVVLHVARAVEGLAVLSALEFAEHLSVRLAGDVGEHVQPTAVGHADGHLVEALLRRALQDLVEQGDHRLAALEAESLLAHVLRLQEGLEGLGLVELAEDAHLLVVRRLLVLALDLALDPPSLHRILDVHVLDADRAAVRVPEHAEDVAQERGALVEEAARDEFAVEVPEGEAVARDVEVGVRALHVLERVDVGHEVAAHAEGVDELLHPGGLVDRAGDVDRDVGRPANGLVGQAQRGEEVLVEVVLPDEELVHLLQELAGPGALDDPVVVGRGECDGLADREVREGLLGRTLELGRVLEGTGADDAALALHEPGHGVHGADAAGVRQRDGRTGEVVGGQLVLAGALHQVLVGGEVLVERHRLGALDRGHQQGTRAVGLGEVDRDAQADVGWLDHAGLAVGLGVEHVLAREDLQCLDDRPADEVRERDLAAAGATQVVVDHDAVVDHELRRDRANARGGRHGEALVHVRGEGLRQALQRDDLVFLGRVGDHRLRARDRHIGRDGRRAGGDGRGARRRGLSDDGARRGGGSGCRGRPRLGRRSLGGGSGGLGCRCGGLRCGSGCS